MRVCRSNLPLTLFSSRSIVFKKNFAYTYFRRFNEKEGVIYFIRLFRFSLDGLLVAQIVILIFFSVTKQVGVYIGLTAVLLPINVAVKLLGTRLWNSQCRAVEDDEANALCGIDTSEALTPSARKRDYFGKNSVYGHANDDHNPDFTSPLDARASGRYPPVVTAPQTNSRVLLLWNHIHDRFNANGNDRPSYVISAQARGSHLSAKIMTNAVANAPKSMAASAAHKTRHYGIAAKTHTGNIGKASKSNVELGSMQEIAPTSADVIKESLQHGKEEVKLKKRRATKQRLKRGPSVRSARSDEAPFLSGFDAVTSHAPVASEEGDQSYYGDGEFERLLSLNRRVARNRSQKNRRSSSYSTTIIKGRPSDMEENNHLPVPQEGDESAAVDSASEEEDMSSEEEEDLEGGALVKPHAKVRWDDTPNNSARYNNPFYSVELDPFLWLPRDPMKPVDLCDTIEWHGAALVSSQGGAGKVGEWDDDQEDEEDGNDEEGDGGNEDDLHGSEEIEIVGPLAQRLQEAEDMEDALDPGASIPRNLMEDYKKAIGDEQDRQGASLSMARSTSMISRRFSRTSAGSEVVAWRRSSHPKQQLQGDEPALDAQKRPVTSEGEASVVSPGTSPTKNTVVESPSGVSFAAANSPGAAATMPASASRRANKAREPSHAASHRTAESAHEGGGDHAPATGGRARTVSMRRALKAEVLEEEYRRTLKVKISEKKRRERQEATEAAAVEAAEGPGNDMELRDFDAGPHTNEQEAGMDTIMARHEKRMNRRNEVSLSRREANISGMSTSSMRATMSSAFMPRRSDPKTKQADEQPPLGV